MNVSVVIPVYNAEMWIAETLESVAEQGDNIEVIVVDDHSPDRSADVAHKFLEPHSLLGRVLTTDQNRGPGHARDLGWKCATSEWIQFLDSDDLLAPEKSRRSVCPRRVCSRGRRRSLFAVAAHRAP